MLPPLPRRHHTHSLRLILEDRPWQSQRSLSKVSPLRTGRARPIRAAMTAVLGRGSHRLLGSVPREHARDLRPGAERRHALVAGIDPMSSCPAPRDEIRPSPRTERPYARRRVLGTAEADGERAVERTVPGGGIDAGQRCHTLVDAAGSPGTVVRSPEDRAARRSTPVRGSGCEREPGESPGLSRSGEWERPPSSALGTWAWEATASRFRRMRRVPASPKICRLWRARRARRSTASGNRRVDLHVSPSVPRP